MRSALPYRLLLLCLCAVAIVHAARASETVPWRDWQSPLLVDHPLAGKIWSARDQKFIAPDELGAAVRGADYLLLGEIHDNADHHRLQAWLVAQAARQKKPALVFEMIPRDLEPKLQSYLESPGADAAGLGAAVNWEKRGWPEWRIYQPITETALRLDLQIRAGDIDSATRKSVGTKGLSTLDATRRRSLHLETALEKPLQDSLLDELYDSHCQLMPRGALSPMSDVQRLRDAVLADSMISAAEEDGAILIAGNGHVRADRAVPRYLSRRQPGARIVTVMMIEVEEGAAAPGDLLPRNPVGDAATNYVWFTPRAEREDPCDELRKRFGKPNKKG